MSYNVTKDKRVKNDPYLDLGTFSAMKFLHTITRYGAQQ